MDNLEFLLRRQQEELERARRSSSTTVRLAHLASARGFARAITEALGPAATQNLH